MNSQSFLRGSIYMLLAVILATKDEFSDLTSEIVAGWTWFDWLKLSITVLGSAIVVLRAYIDSSHGRATGAIPNLPVVTVTQNTENKT